MSTGTEWVHRLKPKASRAMNVLSEGMREAIYDELERNKEGRGIKWPGNKRTSSRPGDPPARQSGRLMESIAVTKRATPDDLSSEVGPRPQDFRNQPPYPVYLEFGTRRIRPRPYMRTAVKKYMRKVRTVKVT